MNCAACNHKAPEVFPFTSVLDFRTRFICGSCVDHRAEPASVAEQASDALAFMPPDIAQAAHVYHRGEYLTVSRWLEREPDDERILDDILRMTPDLDAPRFDRRARRSWSVVLSLFTQFRRAAA